MYMITQINRFLFMTRTKSFIPLFANMYTEKGNLEMREKLIELISDAEWNLKIAERSYGVDNHCAVIADHLIANGVTVQKWIDVDERLPEESGQYIVMIKEAKEPTFLWYTTHRAAWEDEYFNAPYAVTHWMPLPEAPEEDA